jgi:hypothetical protein
MFPAAWSRRHARERLGIEADEIEDGHYITLKPAARAALSAHRRPSWALHR